MKLPKKHLYDLSLSTEEDEPGGIGLHNADYLIVNVRFRLPRKKAHKLYDRLVAVLRKKWGQA
jgi:hypothetical protein